MNKMKMLYIHNQAKKVNNFSYTSMFAAKELGIEFHIASNWSYENDDERHKDEEKYDIKIFQIDFIRKPYDVRNIKAYKQVCQLIKKEKYDVIHCNTPIGGVIGRLAGNKCGVKKIIYQAHGYHFFSNSSLFSWMIYYPIERFLAKYTDCLIVINQEDYLLANKKMRLKKGGRIEFVHGVGINSNPKYLLENDIRDSIGVSKDDFVCISVGDLIKRKNFITVIKAIAECKNKKIKLLICGEGSEQDKLERLVTKLDLQTQVVFLGYRNDIDILLDNSDCYVFSSIQEGLPRSVMEAMIASLPCVVSDIRGNIDLIEDGKGGFLHDCRDYHGFAQSINKLFKDKKMSEQMGMYNEHNIEKYKTEYVSIEMKRIYIDIIKSIG